MTKNTDTAEPAAAEADSAVLDPEDSADLKGAGSTEPATVEVADLKTEAEPAQAKSPRKRRSISIGIRGLVVAVVIALLAGAVATFAWLYVDAQGKLDAQSSEHTANAHAEKVALDYAVNAAEMNYKDLQGWKVKLVAGTTQDLNDKLSEAAKSMEQILVPLEWSSNAQPLVAKVRSSSGGIFVVDCFVSVQTKTVQAPEPLQSTATYSVTLDSTKNWRITDVGGIGSVVAPR